MLTYLAWLAPQESLACLVDIPRMACSQESLAGEGMSVSMASGLLSTLPLLSGILGSLCTPLPLVESWLGRQGWRDYKIILSSLPFPRWQAGTPCLRNIGKHLPNSKFCLQIPGEGLRGEGTGCKGGRFLATYSTPGPAEMGPKSSPPPAQYPLL